MDRVSHVAEDAKLPLMDSRVKNESSGTGDTNTSGSGGINVPGLLSVGAAILLFTLGDDASMMTKLVGWCSVAVTGYRAYIQSYADSTQEFNQQISGYIGDIKSYITNCINSYIPKWCKTSLDCIKSSPSVVGNCIKQSWNYCVRVINGEMLGKCVSTIMRTVNKTSAEQSAK
jgi:hypothetical protein